VKIITECPADVAELASELLQQYHGEVAELKPRIGYYFIEYDAETIEKFDRRKKRDPLFVPPPVLKLHGTPAAATIKVNSYKDRVEGKPDVTVTIDKDVWEHASHDQCTALLDHELEHLLPKTKKGEPVTDDLGRPCFRLKPHDFEASAFFSVVRRHGKAAIEVKTIANVFATEDGQMLLGFADIKQIER
jgi:hypothetical protein